MITHDVEDHCAGRWDQGKDRKAEKTGTELEKGRLTKGQRTEGAEQKGKQERAGGPQTKKNKLKKGHPRLD